MPENTKRCVEIMLEFHGCYPSTLYVLFVILIRLRDKVKESVRIGGDAMSSCWEDQCMFRYVCGFFQEVSEEPVKQKKVKRVSKFLTACRAEISKTHGGS